MNGLNFTEEQVVIGTPPQAPQPMAEVVIPSSEQQIQTQTPEPPLTPEVPVVTATPPEIPVSGDFKPEVIFGEGFDSVDKVKAELAAAKELKDKVAQYESQLKAAQVEDPYIKSLIDWTKQGKDRSLHDLVYHSDPQKMTPEQKVALKLQIETGLSAQDAADYVASKYMIGEDFDESDATVRKARLEMKIDSTLADKELSQWREKQMAPVQGYDYQAQVKSWEPHVQATVNTVKELELAPGIKYPVPADVLAGVQEHINKVLGTEGVEMDASDAEQQKAVQSMASDYIKARTFESALKYLTVEMEKARIRENSNIPKPSPQTPQVVSNGSHVWMKGAAPLPY